jgi:hypothetical protein
VEGTTKIITRKTKIENKNNCGVVMMTPQLHHNNRRKADQGVKKQTMPTK